MAELNEADRFLLDEIRAGRSDAWSQLVERYQGRLLSFARARMPQSADAEDAVQETFLSFLRAIGSFRGESSVETYLFSILHRKVIDAFRGRRSDICLIEEALAPGEGERGAGVDRLAAPDPTASWYARREEERAWQADVLRRALREVIHGYKQSLNFRDLSIIEMLFYCGIRNRDIAALAGVRENHVALLKHRVLARIAEEIRQADGTRSHTGGDHGEPDDALLTRIWRDERLSCLKRSTIGAYLLGTLDDGWQQYVTFHLERLGCGFCRANLEDLQCRTEQESRRVLQDRILQSSIGFLSRPTS